MKGLVGGRIRCRVRITGTYKGNYWEYIDPPDHPGSQFVIPPQTGENQTDEWDLSEYWWTDGNMYCDCCRSRFIGLDLDCSSDEICITKIEPLDKEYPTLYLNETIDEDISS